MSDYDKYYAKNGFNPEEFEFVDYFDMDGPNIVIEYDYIAMPGGYLVPSNPRIAKDENGNDVLSHKGECLALIAKDGYGEFEGRCQHCGQWIRYCCIFNNTVHDELIVVGTICADERMHLTLDEFVIKQETSRIQAEETKKWKAEQVSQWLNEDPNRSVLIEYLKDNASGNEFYLSLLRSFGNKGKLSENQERAAWESKARNEQYQAEREAKLANTPDVPNGRITVTGKIISFKEVHNQYGSQWKMLVEADEGWRFFCTLPSALMSSNKGDRIQLTVTLEQSADDPKFAWGKRPSKASVVGE